MNTIDLSLLPAPQVVVPLDFEAKLAELKALVLQHLPDLADVIELESDPVVKVLEVLAYEHVHMQARINDSARACMLAYAQNADLDHLAALLDVQRLPEETDARLRRRAQMSLEGETVAGSVGSYMFHALSATTEVKDAGVDSPVPGTVRVTVLAEAGDGSPSTALLQVVSDYLSAEERRPLSDSVEVKPAEIVPYAVRATLHVYPGPAAAPLLAAAQEALAAYVAEHQQLGHDITISGLHACLHRPGVQNVVLTEPQADMVIAAHQAPHCTEMRIELGDVHV